ncbi:MAG TPA: hypothetical protein VHN11_18410 [Xanthobacteraceae bacterium]|nr:hypothetical protein [Xanthobacteraceae bacterium]
MAIRTNILASCLIVAAAVPALAGAWPADYPPPPSSGPYWSSRGAFAPVLKSDSCWRTCGAYCSGQFQACVKAYWINDCRTQGDRCDLKCLKRCRTYGGPLLDITD